MTLDLNVAGLWLVGVGSLLAAIPRLVRAPRPQLGLPWETMASRVERVHVALETVGLSTVAAGSVILAVGQLGSWSFDLATAVVVAGAVHLVCAVKLHQLWLVRAETVNEDQGASSMTPTERRELALAYAHWGACLRGAFAAGAPWPPAADGLGRLEPHHIDELHSRDAALADLHIPGSLAPVVDAIRDLGFVVRVAGDLVVATGPGGRTASVSRASLQPNTAGAVLAHHRFIEDLRLLGVPVRTGPAGKPLIDSGGGGLAPRSSEAALEPEKGGQ